MVLFGREDFNYKYPAKASGHYKHFSAGTLIKKRLESLDRDQLRQLDKTNILANQYLLTQQFRQELSTLDKGSHVLFDSHMLIDSDSGVVEIPYDIFEQIGPKRIIFISGGAEQIIKHRLGDSTRKRPIRSVLEIEQQQVRSIELAKQYSGKLAIPFIESNGEAVEEIFKNT